MSNEPTETPNFDDVNKLFVWSLIGAFVLAVVATAASLCLG